MNEISDENTSKIKALYENGILIADDKKFISASDVLSNLKYQYYFSKREDTSKYKGTR